jgi:hypothetical protein
MLSAASSLSDKIYRDNALIRAAVKSRVRIERGNLDGLMERVVSEGLTPDVQRIISKLKGLSLIVVEGRFQIGKDYTQVTAILTH